MAMLDEGAGKLDALAVADRAKTLGADIIVGILARYLVGRRSPR